MNTNCKDICLYISLILYTYVIRYNKKVCPNWVASLIRQAQSTLRASPSTERSFQTGPAMSKARRMDSGPPPAMDGTPKPSVSAHIQPRDYAGNNL